MHDQDHKDGPPGGASDDRHARPVQAEEWRKGQRPHGGTGEEPQAAEYGFGEPNPHGAQYEEGGRYPGTREAGRDPLYHGPDAAATAQSNRDGTPDQDEIICRRLSEELDRSGLEVSRVSVIVERGRVTLQGSVPDEATRGKAETYARECRGVRQVENQLQVRHGVVGHRGQRPGEHE